MEDPTDPPTAQPILVASGFRNPREAVEKTLGDYISRRSVHDVHIVRRKLLTSVVVMALSRTRSRLPTPAIEHPRSTTL